MLEFALFASRHDVKTKVGPFETEAKTAFTTTIQSPPAPELRLTFCLLFQAAFQVKGFSYDSLKPFNVTADHIGNWQLHCNKKKTPNSRRKPPMYLLYRTKITCLKCLL